MLQQQWIQTTVVKRGQINYKQDIKTTQQKNRFFSWAKNFREENLLLENFLEHSSANGSKIHSI